MKSILGFELPSVTHTNEKGAQLLIELLHYKGNQELLLLASCLLHYTAHMIVKVKCVNASSEKTFAYFIKIQ